MCQEAIISGDVTIGEGTVIHPRAKIIAELPIVIGPRNIIEEQVTIINKKSENNGKANIGADNIFECGSCENFINSCDSYLIRY